MGTLNILKKSVQAYRELNRLSDEAMQSVLGKNEGEEDITAAYRNQLALVQQIDSALPEDLSTLETTPEAAALIRERFSVMQEVLEKSRKNIHSLKARGGIVRNEINTIRKGRTSIPAYKEPAQASGRLIQNRG